jgi:hypothetical protein
LKARPGVGEAGRVRDIVVFQPMMLTHLPDSDWFGVNLDLSQGILMI